MNGRVQRKGAGKRDIANIFFTSALIAMMQRYDS
jgi:hypothetical protein